MFVRVFLHEPSLKSTFAQNKSCRSFLPLQLLFWPNFKLPCEFLSFNRSNESQNLVKWITVLHCSSLCRRDAHTGDCHRRRASSTRQRSRPELGVGSCLSTPGVQLRSPSPSSSCSSSRRAKPSRAAVARRAGHPSPPRLDPSRPNLPSLAPHLLHPSTSSIEPFPWPNRARDRRPPLTFFTEAPPSRR